MKYHKATPQVFALTSVAGRVALLCGITAGTVTQKEVEAAVVMDTEKRPHRKPVVAEGMYFKSVTDAAVCLTGARPTRREVMAEQKRIARLCNADNVEGYYWAE
jgi:hypothetical protein